MKYLLLIILSSVQISWGHLAYARLKIGEISPSVADEKTSTIGGKHIYMFDDGVASKNLLIINIGGTGSSPGEYENINTAAAKIGYEVIGVDYSNKTITTTCTHSEEADCFGKFRKEIIFGMPASSIVTVGFKDSLVYRIGSYLRYLAKKRGGQKWRKYLQNGSLDWSKVVLIGHSQGAGHAAYLAKNYLVKAVVMIAGPQDYYKRENEIVPAEWLYLESRTPSQRYISLLHEQDSFGSEAQIMGAQVLFGQGNGNIFLLRENTENPHSDIAKNLKFSSAWNYIFNLVQSY